ncbi:MAG: LPS export ABC transporter permease LptF [Beggiatoa sp.]|nr:LPS export ABC transporter permease LptF [Beggiatoa sp.]
MVLERYLWRESLRAFGAVLLLLTCAYASSRFVQYLADAAAGKLGSDLILELLGLKLLSTSVLMLPLCLYLGIYMALTRLGRDHELTAMGVSLYVAPWAEARLDTLAERARTESDITGIVPGRFKEFTEGDRILYVEGVSDDRRTVSNVFLQGRQEGRLGVLTSQSAELANDPKTGDRYVVFKDGRRYTGTPGRLDYAIVEYRKYAVRLDRDRNDSAAGLKPGTPTAALWTIPGSPATAELQWRIAMPITAVVLPLLAVVLGRLPTGSHRYIGLLSAVLIYFTYSNLLTIGRTLIKKGDLSPYIGLWAVHILLCAVILCVLYYPWLRQRLRDVWAARFARAPLRFI